MRWTAAIVQTAHRLYRRVVSREPISPLSRAHWHTEDILNLLYYYSHDPKFRPSAEELHSLMLLARRLSDLDVISRRLALRWSCASTVSRRSSPSGEPVR